MALHSLSSICLDGSLWSYLQRVSQHHKIDVSYTLVRGAGWLGREMCDHNQLSGFVAIAEKNVRVDGLLAEDASKFQMSRAQDINVNL
jgi:hypothetical protein